MVLRIIWRAVNPTPALPADTPRWQRIAAYDQPRRTLSRHLHRDHAGLGAFRCARPQGDYGSFFGLFHVPQFTSPDKATADVVYEDRHIFFAYMLLALIVLHTAAAVWHHFIKRDRVAARMVDGQAG